MCRLTNYGGSKLKLVSLANGGLLRSVCLDDAVIRHGVFAPDTAFLQRPFTPSGLVFEVRDVLDQPPRLLGAARRS